MTLLLTRRDVLPLLNMEKAIEVIEAAFREQSHGEVVAHAPFSVRAGKVSLRVYAGALLDKRRMGVHAGPIGQVESAPSGESPWIAIVYDANSGELLCVTVSPFGALRTGAVMGVAAKHLSSPSSATVGLIGTGKQAFGILQGVISVRAIKQIAVYSRNREHREEFSKNASQALGVEVSTPGSAEEAVRDKDIVLTATDSPTPVLRAEWLNPRAFVGSVGKPTELPREVYAQANRIAVSSKEQQRNRISSPHPLNQLIEEGKLSWKDVRELSQLVRPDDQLPEPGDLTVFAESGGGFADLALAVWIHQQAVSQGVGQRVDLEG